MLLVAGVQEGRVDEKESEKLVPSKTSLPCAEVVTMCQQIVTFWTFRFLQHAAVG
jgi:hypothetical protein